jgi:hypothetical protein
MGAVAAHGEDGKVSQQGADHQLKDLDAGALFVLKSKGNTPTSCFMQYFTPCFFFLYAVSILSLQNLSFFLSFYSLPFSFSPLFLYPFMFLLIKSLLFLLL